MEQVTKDIDGANNSSIVDTNRTNKTQTVEEL